eukprot:1152498-Pelagomonas_calceolata.AAC.3
MLQLSCPRRQVQLHDAFLSYKLACTRRTLEKTSFYFLYSHHQDQTRGTASNPPGSHSLTPNPDPTIL